VAVFTGAYHSVALTRDGRAYVWGWNTMGQLGLGPLFAEPVLTSPEPARFFLAGGPALAVTEVACGYDYTIVRTASGRLYGFGSNSEGQLGLGDRNNRDVPVAISLLDPRGAQAMSNIGLVVQDQEILTLRTADFVQTGCGWKGAHRCGYSIWNYNGLGQQQVGAIRTLRCGAQISRATRGLLSWGCICKI
jgi:hypothetical protein